VDAVVVIGVIAAADLSQAGHPRLDFQVMYILLVPLEFLLDDRPRPDHAHFPLEDVPHLGQFIQAGFPQKSANGVMHGIVLQLEIAIPFFSACGSLARRSSKEQTRFSSVKFLLDL